VTNSRDPRPYYSTSRDYFGTRRYSPPEIFLKPYWQGEPVDIWTLGTLLYQIVTGQIPFKGLEMITGGLIGYDATQIKNWDALIRIWPVIQGCLEVDPRKRWTANQLLIHLFVNDFELVNIPRITE
jgi:serine/threonine protein kinase